MMIFVKFTSESSTITVTVEVEPTDTVESLRMKLFYQHDKSPNMHRLIFGGKALKDGHTLSDYGIIREAVVHMTLRLRGGGLGGIRIQIYPIHIRTSSGGRKTTIEVEPSQTVQEVIYEFVVKEGIILHDYKAKLLFNGHELIPGRTVSDYNIGSGDTLEFRKQVVSEPTIGSPESIHF